MSKSILVTGGAGFIGSNFIPYFCEKYPEYLVINLDKLTYAGNLDNLKECENIKNYVFVHGDICDEKIVGELFEKYDIYGTLGNDGYFTETTPYAPNSPYSASKAGSDFLVRAYHHTYGMNVTTSNCSNNYGPKQYREKLIPTVIEKALKEEPIPIYGKGSNVRDWLYVLDHCKAVDLIFHKGQSGETYNIGCNNEKTNLEIVRKICSILDELKPRRNGEKYESLITFVQDRAGHDLRYAIDAYKIRTELQWTAHVTFEEGIKKTLLSLVKRSMN